MDAIIHSSYIPGTHVTPSPSSSLIACICNGELKICFSNAPGRCIGFPLRIHPENVRGLRWSNDSARVLIVTRSIVEVIDLEDEQYHARIENGSGGYGSFVSVDFVNSDQVLTIWEYGKAQIWNLKRNQSTELENVKTTADGRRWQIRPTSVSPPVLAYLSRPAADDMLVLHFLNSNEKLPPIRLATSDARSISWSPDGNWIAILDSARIQQNLHLHTSDGHFFRSLPSRASQDVEIESLGVKAITWSSDSTVIALAYHDGHIELLSSRTFTPTAILQCSSTISTSSTSSVNELQIWQEKVSAFQERSYTSLTLPVNLPLSQQTASDIKEQGIVEFAFSQDGNIMATRVATMLNTIWLWNLQTAALQSVLVQHNNVRRMRWHSGIPLLLVDCGDNVAYIYDPTTSNPPNCIEAKSTTSTNLSFLSGSASIVLAASKDGFSLIYTDGRSEDDTEVGIRAWNGGHGEEDSIFEILSGRHRDGEDMSQTQRLELEAAEMTRDDTYRPDDTFDGRRARQDDRDPLDDSDIF
ncbi:hypothetical protein MRB53_040018 [Persea americana]|nr:hypothetical protein MRB53_040018 [Persea americana]